MWKKFALWFIYFGASFLVSDVFKWTDQGRAFLYIKMGGSVALLTILILILLLAGVVVREKLLMSGISFLFIILEIVSIAITLFATWGATKLFDVDFFVAYQIMTFGACLVRNSSSSSSKKKEK